MDYKYANGIKIFAPLTREELIDYALENKMILVAINAEKILHATDKTRLIINRNLGFPDGMGAVWALKKKGQKKAIKIPGCELWLDIIRKFYKTKSFYLIGGKQEVIKSTVNKLKQEFSGIDICGFRNGYIESNMAKKKLTEDIIEKKPDVIFVAMGSPKQELFMEDIQSKHNALYQGLGGSFDVYTGRVQRASNWWIKHSLEWAYRLIKQPARIKRQIYLIKFIIFLKLGRY